MSPASAGLFRWLVEGTEPKAFSPAHGVDPGSERWRPAVGDHIMDWFGCPRKARDCDVTSGLLHPPLGSNT